MDVPDPRERGEQRRQRYRQLKAGATGIVAASCGLIALYAGASLTRILIAVGSGLLIGVVLVAIVFPGSDYVDTSNSRRNR